MNTSLREFFKVRRTEIRKQMAALEAELRDLDTAEAAVFGPVTHHIPPRRASSPTIKEMVVAVLRDIPQGADANQIIALVADQYGVDVPRSSMSPQLSRLKTDGVLELDGKTWTLSSGPTDSENSERKQVESREDAGQGLFDTPSETETPDAPTSSVSSDVGEGDTSPNESRDIDDVLG